MHPQSDKLLSVDPLFMEGNSVGFLFLHGFTGAPYEGREIASRLHREEGYTVSVPLLPGHGTDPEDLKGRTWLEWYAFSREKLLDLQQRCDRVFLCGQSMGGALALHLASHHPVDGLITLAAAVYLKDWRLRLLPLARHLVPYQYKSKGPDIRNQELKPRIPTYPKYPVRSVDQLLGLLNHTRQDLLEVTAPILLMHSRRDRTVNFDNLDYIYSHISSAEKQKVILEESYHVISIDVEKETVYRHIKQFIADHLSRA